MAVVVACLVTAIIVISGRPGASARPRASGRPAAPSATVRWTYDTGDGGEIRPVVGGGTVYIGSAGETVGTVYALRAP